MMVGMGKAGEVGGGKSLNLDLFFFKFQRNYPKERPKKNKCGGVFWIFWSPKVNQAHKVCYCVRAIGVLSFKLRVPKCQPSSSRVILFLKTKRTVIFDKTLLQQILDKLLLQQNMEREREREREARVNSTSTYTWFLE